MAVTRDATSRWYLPANATECTELLAGTSIATPSNLYLFNEAAAPILDKIGSKNLALGSGDTAPAYQQFLPGWSATRVMMTVGAATRLLNTTFPNVNANSYTVALLARPTTQAADRTLVRFGDIFDDDATLEINGSSVLKVGEGDATRSTGADSVIDAAHFFVLRIDDTANTVDAFFNGTKIAGGTQACNGTELCVGGNNVQTYLAAGAWLIWMGVWTNALSDADVPTLVSRMKDGVPASASTGYSRSRVVNV